MKEYYSGVAYSCISERTDFYPDKKNALLPVLCICCWCAKKDKHRKNFKKNAQTYISYNPTVSVPFISWKINKPFIMTIYL